MSWLAKVLRSTTRQHGGALRDDLEYPAIAFRELIGNALVHRSFRPADANTKISIHVTDEMVTITSPGTLAVAIDQSKLGLEPMAAPRNYGLVRICENLRTPSGARIIESGGMGIRRADRACHDANVLPPLFVVTPTSFTAVCIRNVLDMKVVSSRWPEISKDPEKMRLMASIERLGDLSDVDAGSVLSEVRFDAPLAARILVARTAEQATRSLDDLVSLGAIEVRTISNSIYWQRLETPAAPQSDPFQREPVGGEINSPGPLTVRRKRGESKFLALEQIDEAPAGQLRTSEFNLGISTRKTRETLSKAREEGYVEATTDVPYHADRGYRLTKKGRLALATWKARRPRLPNS